MRRLIIFIILPIVVWSCGSNSADQDSKAFLDSLEKAQATPVESAMSADVVNDIIKSVPSPLEMTALIKESGAEFSTSILNNTDNKDKYSSQFKKALNLGAYGADLGYINIYEKTSKAFSYLTAVKSLADELKVGQFFDFNTIKRLAENNTNLDSVIYISTAGFEDMNNYLSSKGRSNISLLILVGGWSEALYIATEVVKNSNSGSQELIDRIGEQKIVLDDLSLIISAFENDPIIKTLDADLADLKAAYEEVTITYEYAEPEMKEVNGVLTIVDNSTSKIEVSEEQLAKITSSISAFRNKIIE